MTRRRIAGVYDLEEAPGGMSAAASRAARFPGRIVGSRSCSEDALRRGVAEFIGAFTLIFIGAGSIVAAGEIHDPSLIGVAIAHGLAIGVMVSALGHISGAHFNPAITFGFLITRRIKPALGVLYWVAQLAGAALAALLVTAAAPRATTEAVKLGVPALGNGVDAATGVRRWRRS